MPVLRDLDHGREQHIRYKQKVASRRQFEDRFQSLAKQTFDAAFECHLSKNGDGKPLFACTGYVVHARDPGLATRARSPFPSYSWDHLLN